MRLLSLALLASLAFGQTKVSNPLIVLPPPNRATGSVLEMQDSTSVYFVGLTASTNLPKTVIVSLTAANPSVLTFASAPTVSIGSVLIIGGAAGCPGLNGTQSVTAVSGVNVTINFNATACGSYAGSSASAATSYWVLPNADAVGCWASNGASDIVIGGCLPVIDSTIITVNASDTSKKMRFDNSGITTGNTRVLKIQDSSYTLAGTNISNTFNGNQSFDTDIIMTGSGGSPGSIDFDNPAPGIGAIKLTIPTSGGSIYQFVLPPDGGTNNYVLKTNGSGTTSWASVSSLLPSPLSISTATAAFAISGTGTGTNSGGIFGTATGSGGSAGYFVNGSSTGTSTYALYAKDDAVNSTVAYFASTVSGGIGLNVETSGSASQAAIFNNGTAAATYAALTAENDGGGTGQGAAAIFRGSVYMYGTSSSNELIYNAPSNYVKISNVSGGNATLYPTNFAVNGSGATDAYIIATNSSNYEIGLGFSGATVPVLYGGSIGSPVAGLPLPSNTPTSGYVLTGNGAGTATSWQAAGADPAWPTYTTTAGSLTISSQNCRALQSGKTTKVRCKVYGTYTGTTGNYMTLTLPYSPLDNDQTFAGFIQNSTSSYAAAANVTVSGTTATVGTLSGFVNGFTYTIVIEGVYETT